MDIQKLAFDNRIFYTQAGSHSYGLNTESSDEDFRGVFVGNPENVAGLFPVEHCEYTGDNMLYELKKFITLARDCNPNIIELLFVDEIDILLNTPFWERIRENREWFLTRRAKHTFSGYATAQLKRIRGHNKWLLDPQPEQAPSPAKYVRKTYIEGLGERELFDQNAYEQALRQWKQYWEWRNNRNEKRAELEAQHGFDSKHGMHTIRLMRMATEILRGDGVIVKRPDRDELLAIRNGNVSFDELMKMAEDYEKQLEMLYETSPLPRAPDSEKINNLLLETYREFWQERACW
jgi:predicted nucleotidyltransferase